MTLRASILFFIFVLIAPAVSARQESFPFVAQVTSDKVNIRAGQSKNFEDLCQLKKGDQVMVVDKSYSWYKIKLPVEAKSFISAKYVQLLNPQEGLITGDRVNIRAGKDVNTTALGQLIRGDRVRILETLDKWYRIAPTENSYGWILGDYVLFKTKDLASYRGAELEKIPLSADQPQKVLPATQGGLVSISGRLELADGAGPNQYQLLTSDETYNVSGPRPILDSFLHYKVTLDGVLTHDPAPEFSPTIKFSKIKLLL